MVFPGFRGESYAMLRATKEKEEEKGNKCLREGLHRIIEVMGGRYCKQYQTQEMRYHVLSLCESENPFGTALQNNHSHVERRRKWEFCTMVVSRL
jgi:hypothetical protein